MDHMVILETFVVGECIRSSSRRRCEFKYPVECCFMITVVLLVVLHLIPEKIIFLVLGLLDLSKMSLFIDI